MDDTRDNKDGQTKKPYLPPAIEEIELETDEAILAACKQPSTCPGNVRKPDAS